MALRNLWTDWHQSPPLFLHHRSSKSFIVFSVSMAVFTDIFLYGVIVPVIPFALEEQAGISNADTQYWVSVLLSVYAAFLVAFSPLAGWIADRTSTRRLPFLISLVFLAGATVLLTLGRSIGVLIAGRALQGISAAAVWSIGLALLVDTLGSEDIGEAMGYVSLSMSLAVFCAPLLGGVVYQSSGYRTVYYMAFGIIVLDFVLRLLVVEKKVLDTWLVMLEPSKTSEQENREDLSKHEMRTKTIAERASMSFETPRLTSPRDTRLDHTDSGNERSLTVQEGMFSDGVPPLQHLTASIRRHKVPAVLSLLASRRLIAALWASMALSTIMTSFDTVLPLHVAGVFHWDSIGAGLVFLAIVVPSFLNPLIGKIADRYGTRILMTAGFLLNIPLLACLRFIDRNTISQKILLCVLLAMLGFSLSSALIPILAEITYAVDAKMKEDPIRYGRKGAYAQGYGLMNAAYAAGSLIGPLWSGFVNERAGWSTMSLSLAVLSGISAVPTILFIEGWIQKKPLGSRLRCYHSA